MRVAIIQPPYPEKGEAVKILKWQTERLAEIRPGSVDLVLFPENANCTGYTDLENMKELIRGEGAEFVKALRKTAERVNCTIMSGLMTLDDTGALRNQLGVFSPAAEPFFPYTKIHLVEPELAKGIVPGRSASAFECMGIRFGAAICFDSYFPEQFVQYAEQRIDVMIVASHQRQERSGILEFLSRARAFDCGCTLLRAAPAMPVPNTGGRSMAVSPDGTILADAGCIPGVISCEIDPGARFLRPASYGEPDRVGDYREVLMVSRKHVNSGE